MEDLSRRPDYQEWRLHASQAPGLDALWMHGVGVAPRPHRMPPHWQISLGVERKRDRHGALASVHVLAIGPVESSYVYAPQAGTELIALRVEPERATDVLGLHPREHRNLISQLAPSSLVDPIRRLAEADAAPHLVGGALLNALRPRLHEIARARHAAHLAASWLRESEGQMRVDSLAVRLGVAERTLRRQFVDTLGVSPKMYAGMVRLNALLHAADGQGDPDWADLAVRFGFADQAHMVRSVAQMIGLTPSRLHRERRGVAEIFNTPPGSLG